MPILSPTGRTSWKHRLLVGSIYSFLLLGGVTMVYPLLLMVAGSTKSGTDQDESRVIPSFWSSDRALYGKHVEGLFNESLDLIRNAYGVDVYGFADLAPPVTSAETMLVREWDGFLRASDPPSYAYSLGYTSVSRSRGVQPSNLRAFQADLRRQFGEDIGHVNNSLRREFVDWNDVVVPLEDYRVRRGVPSAEPYDLAYQAFKRSSQLTDRHYFVLEPFFRNGYLRNQYANDLANYNAAHGTSYADWVEVSLPRRAPAKVVERHDWEVFVRDILSPLWIGADDAARPAYHDYLRARYTEIATLNLRYQAAYTSFDAVPLPGLPLPAGVVLSDWNAFLQGWLDPSTRVTHKMPLDAIVLRGIDYDFRDSLSAKYGSVSALNAALGTTCTSFDQILPPQQQWHYQQFSKDTVALRWELSVRNFRTVADYILLRGRGVLNTAVYCTLAVLGSLIVNPLAAYALSRYRPNGVYKILLFLMITMAFPPMVTQIPAFLLVRDFNLLNTFWALILPGLAYGYSIFLLKGFFDSLPQELYESASLDGAGEFRIFWQITMSLSKPILAVIALNAFIGAYSNFMFALLICQDQKMWTITVWLYQLQTKSGSGVVYASLLLAAIPTFLIFALCQNIIMRGIVVPVEK